MAPASSRPPKLLWGFSSDTNSGDRTLAGISAGARPRPAIKLCCASEDALGGFQKGCAPSPQPPLPLPLPLVSDPPSERSGQAAASDPEGDRSADASIVIIATGCLQSYVSGGNPPHP